MRRCTVHKQYQLMRDLVPVAPLIDTGSGACRSSVCSGEEPGRTARSLPGRSPGPSTTVRPVRARTTTWPASCLGTWPASTSCMCPYKGSTGARNDILSGQIQMLFDSVPTMAPMIKAGLVRALGTTGKTRSPTLPDRADDCRGWRAWLQRNLWVGFMAPAATRNRSWTSSIARSPGSLPSLPSRRPGKNGCDADYDDANRFQGVYGWAGRQMGERHQAPIIFHQSTDARTACDPGMYNALSRSCAIQ